MSRPKVLFASARPPYPLDTGAKIRSWHLLAAFAQRFEVEVLTFRDPSVGSDWLREARHLGVARVVMVENPHLNRAISTGMFIRASLRGLPVSVMKYRSPEFSARLREMIAAGSDLLHLEHVHLAGELKGLPREKTRPQITLDAHNVECQIAGRMRDMAPSLPRKCALALHARNMRRFETWAFGNCDLIMAVSREDAAAMSAMTGERASTTVVENGVDAAYFAPADPREIRPGSLVFVGSMDWLPNADAVTWFAAEVLPLIRGQRPECSLTIVGRAPLPEVAALHDPDHGLVVTGTVEDVRPYLGRAEVVITPLRYAGGTRLKILEAFSMAKAVVSTTIGSEGIAYVDGRHLLLGDDPESLSRQCLKVMNQPQLREELGMRGRRLALERYTWSAITGRMLDRVDRLMGGCHE